MILQLLHIDFSFSPEIPLLKEINLTLKKGRVYGFMGSNGAGKTTLFNLITGFIKPKRGEFIFGENKITHKQPYKINQQGISDERGGLKNLVLKVFKIFKPKGNITGPVVKKSAEFLGNKIQPAPDLFFRLGGVMSNRDVIILIRNK